LSSLFLANYSFLIRSNSWQKSLPKSCSGALRALSDGEISSKPRRSQTAATTKNVFGWVVSELGGAGRAATRRASQREARHLEIRSLPLAEVAWYGLCQNAIILDLTNFRHVPFCLFHAETEFLIHGGAKIQFS
jgi:hypothetical protein